MLTLTPPLTPMQTMAPPDAATATATVAAPAPAASPLVVIGCGNLNRSDDAAGVRVIECLRREFGSALPDDVRLFDAGTGGMDVMFQSRGAASLVIVDASRSGSEAGAVFRVPGSEIAAEHTPTYSLHDFRWEHAVYAGRRLYGAAFPSDLTVYLIEAGSLELGLEMTPPVERAVETVCGLIAERIRGGGSGRGAAA